MWNRKLETTASFWTGCKMQLWMKLSKNFENVRQIMFHATNLLKILINEKWIALKSHKVLFIDFVWIKIGNSKKQVQQMWKPFILGWNFACGNKNWFSYDSLSVVWRLVCFLEFVFHLWTNPPLKIMDHKVIQTIILFSLYWLPRNHEQWTTFKCYNIYNLRTAITKVPFCILNYSSFIQSSVRLMSR